MKKFTTVIALLAIFILPASLCTAKDYAQVYSSSWNQFLGNLQSRCNAAGISFTGTHQAEMERFRS